MFSDGLAERGTYALVMCDGFRDERVDEERQLLRGWWHYGKPLGYCDILVRLVFLFFSHRTQRLVDTGLGMRKLGGRLNQIAV